MIDFLAQEFAANPTEEALIWRDQSYDYGWLLQQLKHWQGEIRQREVSPGAVIALEGDFSPQSIALFLALIDNQNILVPLTPSVEAKKDEFRRIAQPQWTILLNERDQVEFEQVENSTGSNDLYETLRKRNHPGLVLFSSGSTGDSKAAVHDLTGLLEKFKVRRKKMRTVAFLQYDHIGGVNTLLYTLSNGGCLLTVQDRDADHVLSLVSRHRIQLLPTSPTFMNLILLSESHTRYDLSALELVTYGTEPMPESTLKRFHQALPHVQLQQTYGLSELGIMRSKSKSSDSLWVRLGGEGFETRIVDGILQIKAQSAMLGYLNAPSPFTADGWFITGDSVEVDGEYFRILGRVSEIINVGGEKVYPAEVESIIHEMAEVDDVTVFAEKSPIMGQVVCARVSPTDPGADERTLTRAVKKFCKGRMQRYKIPVKVKITDAAMHSSRFKKTR